MSSGVEIRRSLGGRQHRGDSVFKWLPFILAEASILFLFIPSVLLIYLAFTRWRVTYGPWWSGRFAGLQNFISAFSDDRFLEAFFRTLCFVAIAVPLEILIGLLLAYLCFQPFKGQRLITTIFLLPMMTVPAVVGYNSNMLFVQEGPINQILSLITWSNIQIGWLSDPRGAQAAVIFSDVWQWTPLMFLIFMSGFSAIPTNLSKAAKILGASSWQIFRDIELPLMRPVILLAMILRVMEVLKIFDIPMLLNNGGPGNATETIAIYLYRVTWEQMRVSNGAGMSLILFLFTLGLIFAGIWFLKTQRMRANYRG